VATLQLINDFAGRTIGNFYVEEKIGDGGYGTVYRARHMTLDDRVVAIKVLKQEALHDPTLIERFKNEARAAARVKHPGIVRIDDIGEHRETGSHYIVMEYLRGMDLQRWLSPHREGLPLADVLAILYDVADALDAVHDLGIIHRDLKPENLFRQEDGLVKVLDLGIAKLTPDLVGSFRTATNIVLGSPGYFAPELADPKRSSVDRRSDVFSLAAVAYELITHDKPWRFNDQWHYLALIQKADEKRPRDLRFLRPETPAAWSRTILSALSKDPSERPATAGELVRRLADEFPGGDEIIARRADAIRAARGLPPAARASTSPPAAAAQDAPREHRSRTPVLETQTTAPQDPAAPLPPASPPVESSPANDATLRVQAPQPSTEHAGTVTGGDGAGAGLEHDPSRVPTLVPERIPTLVAELLSPDRVPTLVPERVPTLVPAPIATLPTGPIPELLAEPESDVADTGPTKTPEPAVSAEERPASFIVSGTVAASAGAAQPDARVESRSVLLDPSLAADSDARESPRASAEPGTPGRSRVKWRTLAAVGLVLAAGGAVVLTRSAATPSNSTAATKRDSSTAEPGLYAPTIVAVTSPVDAAAVIAADIPPDAAAMPVLALDASPDAAAQPTTDEKPATAQSGKVEVYANELTDVFLVAGSRPKFLGTTPLPRASVPAGTVTLELRSRGRKTTRKVNVRAGRKARVEHTWPPN